MKNMLALTVAALALAGTAAAAPRNHTGFNAVSAQEGVRVEVTVGGAFSVDVSGQHADRVVTRIEDGTLVIEAQDNVPWRLRRDALVRVTMPSLASVDTSSGANVEVSGVNGGAVNLDASSGSNLTLAGTCGVFNADVSSGAILRSQALHCETGNIDVSSGANAHVFASQRINVDASSGGRVVVHGGGAVGDADFSSGGSMSRAS